MPLLLCLLAALPALEIEKRVLSNGLEVILSEDHRLPVVAVDMVYHVGAIDEPRTRTGFAHLFEHLMFQGSAHVADEQHFQLLSDAGAGTVNAETQFDFTEYYETVPSNELPLALWLESDRMASLAFDQNTLEVQRGVVKNERRESFEDAPYGRLQEALLKALFPATHPYADGIIGSMAHLNAATLDDTRAFFKTYYTPKNATLAIVGDFDKAQTMQLVEAYFGAIAGAEKPAHLQPLLPEKPAQARIVIDEPIAKSAKIVIAWVTAPFGHEDDVALEAWADLLGGGKGSRLSRALVTELRVAQEVDARVDSLAGGSTFEITVTPLRGVEIAKLEASALKAVEQALAKAPTEAELKRVIARDETARLMDIESPGGDEGLANLLQLFNHYTGDPSAYRKELARYQTLTPEKLSAASERWLTPERRVVAIAKPVTAKSETIAANPPPKAQKRRVLANDRAPPPHWPEPNVRLPQFKRFSLENGIDVWLAEDHALPIVGLSLAIEALDSSSIIAYMAEGAAGKNAAELDEAFGNLGTWLDAHGGRDGAYVQTLVTSDRVEPAWHLLSDLLQFPTLDPTDLAPVKERLLATRDEALSDPYTLGMEHMAKALFAGHRYGQPRDGGEQAIAALKAEDYAKIGAFSCVFVGDITPARAVELAKKYFGALPPRAHAPVPISARAQKASTHTIDKPGLGQTFIGLGALTVPYNHPDRDALDLVSDVFAGLFNSRVNLRLREELAITYGVNGSHNTLREAGALLAIAQVNQDATARGLKEMYALVDGLQKKPITDAELTSAKRAFLRSLPGRFTHRFDTASSFASLLSLGADGDVFRDWPVRVAKVSLQDVRKAAAKYLKRDRLQTVLVRDPAAKL